MRSAAKLHCCQCHLAVLQRVLCAALGQLAVELEHFFILLAPHRVLQHGTAIRGRKEVETLRIRGHFALQKFN